MIGRRGVLAEELDNLEEVKILKRGSLEDLGEVEVLRPPDLELAGPEDGHVVVDDGVLLLVVRLPQHDPLLFLHKRVSESSWSSDLSRHNLGPCG